MARVARATVKPAPTRNAFEPLVRHLPRCGPAPNAFHDPGIIARRDRRSIGEVCGAMRDGLGEYKPTF